MIRRQVKRILCMAIMSLIFTSQGVFARDSQFTRQGAGPMYWISYEHQYTKNTYMPEKKFKENIDWMAENFLPYGYDMVSTDGWIEGATMLNRNGYVLSHNDRWMTNPLDMSEKEENTDSTENEENVNLTGKVINGDFEDGETGWNFIGTALHGINGNEQDAVNSLYTWKWEPHDETISQTIGGLSTGKYTVSVKAKTKNGMPTNGSVASMRIKGYDASKEDEVDETSITSEQWTTYTKEIDVTSGSIDLEFYYDSKGTNSAGLDLDDITVEPIIPGQPQPVTEEPVVEEEWQYSEDKYPDGHTWRFWADYAKSKGLKYGVYYNPLWVSPEVVKHPDKYTVVGHPEIKVSDLIVKDPNGDLKGGDRFNGGQGSERALYWLNVDAPGAEEFIKGYVKFFKDQGVSFLRVDFLSWYETPSTQGIKGINHTREQYEKALKWMSEAAGTDMILSLVMPNLKDHGELERKYGDMIRIDEDVFGGGWDHTSGRRQEWIGENWSQWASAFQGLTGFADINGRGSLINDADFIRLNTFTGKYADNERKSEISLYTIAGAPITIADQYDTIGNNAKFYQNTELIELNKIGLSGKPIFNDSAHYKDNKSRDSERWIGQLPDGSYAVGLFNRSDEQKTLTIDFDKELGINQGSVRDLWAHEDLGTKKSYTAVLEPHDCTIIKVVPAAQDKKYQAEIASYEGAKFNGSNYESGAEFNNNRIGYTGNGFIENIATSDDKVTFAVDAPSDGNYKFKINYANGEEDASINFYAREKVSGDTIDTKEVSLPTTNSLNKWRTEKQSLTLKKGINLITVQGKTGSINLDSIKMLGSSDAAIVNGDFES